MRKKYDFDELIDRLDASIAVRHPEKHSEHLKAFLRVKWAGKEKKLRDLVYSLEQQEHKVDALNDKYDDRKIEFQVGCDVIGNPIIVQHFVRFKKETTKWNGKFSKNGSKNIWSANYQFFGKIIKAY